METFRGEWVAGGDLVRFDEDGYLEHHGRADEALKVSGRWLAPQEVESCLLTHEAVEQCVVVGVPDAAGLVKPVAFVVVSARRPGLEAELVEHVLAAARALQAPAPGGAGRRLPQDPSRQGRPLRPHANLTDEL